MQEQKFTRLKDETEEELIYRIASQKDIIGSWQNVADVLNELLGYQYSESKYRKTFQAFEKMLEANKNKFVEDKYIKELDKKYAEIRKERIKLQTVNTERTRIDRSISRQELFYDYISRTKEQIPIPQFNPIPSYKQDKEYLLTLADIHYGAEFISENNQYSPLIAKQRLEKLAQETIDFVKEKKLSKLNILCLGDVIQGLLRIKDLKLNDSSIVKATVEVSRLIAQFLNVISKYCVIEYFHTPTANHTQLRVLGAKANELGQEDIEYVVGHYISDLCSANKRIKTHIEDRDGIDYIKIPIWDYTIIATHGHTIKNIGSSIKDLSILQKQFIDYLILGHFHSGQEIPCYEKENIDCEILISPSFIGSDPFSDSIYKGTKSAVKIYGFDKKKGHTESYKIILN